MVKARLQVGSTAQGGGRATGGGGGATALAVDGAQLGAGGE